ncbi:MAG: DEDD exonuclease domain-containing protein [Actinomycetes bacterium]
MPTTIGSRPDPSTSPGQVPGQVSFDEIGQPLVDTTFVVVDLETTGGSPTGAAITEIGAVKVRGGVVLDEFATLVDPAQPIPAFIAVLTGITDALVAGAPELSSVLPAFLEFAHGAVLVAHNAPFDVGFLRAGAARLDLPWPDLPVVDTARLARVVLDRDEAPNCKLATLAALFHATTTPEHRALADARATVDVLHGLIERLGGLGLSTLDELTTFTSQVSVAQRRKRHLADRLPESPGVYLFTAAGGRVLYIGTSKNLRSRVRTYFTAAETRPRMRQMVSLATGVTPILCPTSVEAQVREVRMIAQHRPAFNRRSRAPERTGWLALTREPFPRLSLVRRVRSDDDDHLGPFPSMQAAQATIEALQEALPLRQCRTRLSPRRPSPSCVLAEIGRCQAPCTGAQTVQEYAAHVDAARAVFTTDPSPVVEVLEARISALAAQERYEEAAPWRDRLVALLRTCARAQRRRALTGCAELVAARPEPLGGWEVLVVRYGRLAASGHAPPGAWPGPYLQALLATAESVPEPSTGTQDPEPGAITTVEETEILLRWLDEPGVRLIEVTGAWTCPVRGAERFAPVVTGLDRSDLSGNAETTTARLGPVGRLGTATGRTRPSLIRLMPPPSWRPR